MRVLVACEESQEVTKAFRALGHEAYSCDIEPCSGGYPEWHIQDDVLHWLDMGRHLADMWKPWDLIIAHPPCTDLAVSGAAWFKRKQADGSQLQSMCFFMQFTDLACPRVAIENPVGIMSTYYRKPDQIIQPYMFGEPFSKKTCLWLKGLPLLIPTKLVEAGERVTYASGRSMPKWYADAYSLPAKERAKVRSKTFPGIAQAMAEQWGGL